MLIRERAHVRSHFPSLYLFYRNVYLKDSSTRPRTRDPRERRKKIFIAFRSYVAEFSWMIFPFLPAVQGCNQQGWKNVSGLEFSVKIRKSSGKFQNSFFPTLPPTSVFTLPSGLPSRRIENFHLNGNSLLSIRTQSANWISKFPRRRTHLTHSADCLLSILVQNIKSSIKKKYANEAVSYRVWWIIKTGRERRKHWQREARARSSLKWEIRPCRESFHQTARPFAKIS